MLKLLLFTLFIFHTTYAFSDLYRCENESGQVRFTDQPCPHQGQTFQPKSVMTPYKTIQPISSTQSKTETAKKNQEHSCPFFSSSELRNLRVKDQYKKGLTPEHIKARLGKPHDITSSNNKETWHYTSEHVSRTFRFKKGCLSGWREKWKGKESQISKFRDER